MHRQIDVHHIHNPQEILKLDPGNGAAHEGLAEAYLQSGDYESAEKHFRKALAVDAGRWKSRNFLGLIYDHQKRRQDAIAEYETEVSLRPKDPGLRNNLGLWYLTNKEYEKAIAEFDQAVQLGGTDPRIYNNLALALDKVGRYQDAWEAFRKTGTPAKAYNNLGVAFLEEGLNERATVCFQKAIELSPAYYQQANENLLKAQGSLRSNGSQVNGHKQPTCP